RRLKDSRRRGNSTGAEQTRRLCTAQRWQSACLQLSMGRAMNGNTPSRKRRAGASHFAVAEGVKPAASAEALSTR
ncbi:hypothetical protein, partial [Methylibium sp.]|uniref:hypothetical protein n=1 Tax=Methylibium sp. TaxID=2067992 RepID=UPI0025F7BA06